jgi:hypothetical protein
MPARAERAMILWTKAGERWAGLRRRRLDTAQQGGEMAGRDLNAGASG